MDYYFIIIVLSLIIMYKLSVTKIHKIITCIYIVILKEKYHIQFN